jgi:hypothetical protein
MKRWIKRFEDVLSAASFAESGEFDTARDILREGRRVLLAIREEKMEREVLKYAMNTCKRIRTDMDILYLSSANSGGNPMLKQFFSELQSEGINYRLIQKNGSLREEIKNYTDSERSICFVVAESFTVDRWSKEGGLSKILEKIKYPLVVVDVP